jgi:hypothetical protein
MAGRPVRESSHSRKTAAGSGRLCRYPWVSSQPRSLIAARVSSSSSLGPDHRAVGRSQLGLEVDDDLVVVGRLSLEREVKILDQAQSLLGGGVEGPVVLAHARTGGLGLVQRGVRAAEQLTGLQTLNVHGGHANADPDLEQSP